MNDLNTYAKLVCGTTGFREATVFTRPAVLVDLSPCQQQSPRGKSQSPRGAVQELNLP